MNFRGIQDDSARLDGSCEIDVALEAADGEVSPQISLHIAPCQGEPELPGARHGDGSHLTIHSDPAGEPLSLTEVLPDSGV